MYTLPNANKASIPLEKLSNYALDFDKDPNKAESFRVALGYTSKNAAKLASNISENINSFEAVLKGNHGYGDLYEVVMHIAGENGKSANVLTSWIIENGTDFPRLTSVYVTKKKSRSVVE